MFFFINSLTYILLEHFDPGFEKAYCSSFLVAYDII